MPKLASTEQTRQWLASEWGLTVSANWVRSNLRRFARPLTPRKLMFNLDQISKWLEGAQ